MRRASHVYANPRSSTGAVKSETAPAFSPDRLMQRIQDEQGWIVLAGPDPMPMGSVIRDANEYTDGSGCDMPPVVVIGEASAEEFRAQTVRYSPRGYCYEFPHYVKVIAE